MKRKLYPNVDFYSGIMYQAMGFRPEMFTVLFAIPRTAGWLAQWQELMNDRSKRSPARARFTPDRGKGIHPDRQARASSNSCGIPVALNI